MTGVCDAPEAGFSFRVRPAPVKPSSVLVNVFAGMFIVSRSSLTTNESFAPDTGSFTFTRMSFFLEFT